MLHPTEVVSGTVCPYTITRSWNFTDSCCRSQTHSQVITVQCDSNPITTSTIIPSVTSNSIPASTGIVLPVTTGSIPTTVLSPLQTCQGANRDDWAYGQGYYCYNLGNGLSHSFVQCWGNTYAVAQYCGVGTVFLYLYLL